MIHGDPTVARVGRGAAAICVVTAVVAWLTFGWRMAAGVLGGGLLIGVSFYSLGGGVAALVAAATGDRRSAGTMGGTLVKVVLRYALLGFLAYVMIARLRLHPIGLLVGASSIAAAVALEAARYLTKQRP